jgi:hypothetical protein
METVTVGFLEGDRAQISQILEYKAEELGH